MALYKFTLYAYIYSLKLTRKSNMYTNIVILLFKYVYRSKAIYSYRIFSPYIHNTIEHV